MRTAILVVASICIGVAGTASAWTWWMPLREVRRQSYVDTSGEAVPRYQWRTVTDERQSGACVLVLTDTVTGAFAITSIPADACQ